VAEFRREKSGVKQETVGGKKRTISSGEHERKKKRPSCEKNHESPPIEGTREGKSKKGGIQDQNDRREPRCQRENQKKLKQTRNYQAQSLIWLVERGRENERRIWFLERNPVRAQKKTKKKTESGCGSEKKNYGSHKEERPCGMNREKRTGKAEQRAAAKPTGPIPS